MLNYPTRANVNTFPIPVRHLGCALHAKWYTLQITRVSHKWVIRLSMPPMCTGKWGPSDYYTGSATENLATFRHSTSRRIVSTARRT